jgi:hypothetical protein
MLAKRLGQRQPTPFDFRIEVPIDPGCTDNLKQVEHDSALLGDETLQMNRLMLHPPNHIDYAPSL